MLEQYYRLSKATGVSIHIDNSGTLKINACSIILEKNQLNFEKKLLNIDNIGDLTKHVPFKSVISLNLSGKGILTKQFNKTEEINTSSFSKVLPNANPDDFYIQNFISGELSFVSVIRKTDADKWINNLIALGFKPLSVSLGPFPAQNILSQLNVYRNELIFDGHIISFNKQSNWAGQRYDPEASSLFPLKIELEPIDEQLVLAYAIAFQLLLESKIDVIQANVYSLEITFDDILNQIKLKVQGIIILAIFFIVLLINFIVFSWLDDSNTRLIDQLSRSAQNSIDLKSLNGQIEQKEDLLKSLDWEDGINKSTLTDQVASLLPPELILQEIVVNPVDFQTSRSSKSIIFFNREIKVTGNSEKILPVNEWIARIKTKTWVKNIQLDNYTYNNELNTGQFSITINY